MKIVPRASLTAGRRPTRQMAARRVAAAPARMSRENGGFADLRGRSPAGARAEGAGRVRLLHAARRYMTPRSRMARHEPAVTGRVNETFPAVLFSELLDQCWMMTRSDKMRRPRKCLISGASFVVAGAGFEPATFGL